MQNPVTHYPTLEAAVLERIAARGIDLEQSTSAFLLQIRTGRSRTRAGHDLFALKHPRDEALTDPRPLAPSEEQVMPLVASGLTNAEIAEALHKDYETIKMQKKSAFKKLGASNAPHATALWILRRFEEAA